MPPDHDHPPPDQFDDQPYSDEEINQQAINLGEPYFTDDPDEECYNDCGVDCRHSVSECPQNGWDEEDEQIQDINFHGSYITDDPDEECFNNYSRFKVSVESFWSVCSVHEGEVD